ncbi:MAG TPA: LacI family DNA-binding transcriptional regulator [Angustibacter sp.]|nr:LacI family DNA-binding transcriptional regulator [Angustibacter sp.]
MVSRIEDVAQAAGVSTATVSRALRGLPKVSDSTRAKVLKAAADLQYVASPTASSLASGKTHVVGVVVPYVTRWYFAHLISGASEVLREQGFHVLLFDVGDEGPHRALLLDSRMLFKRVDAVLILSLRLHQAERELLRRLNVPVVTVGVPDDDWPCVRIDDYETTRLATEHLIALGHRHIGYVGGDTVPSMDFPTPADRARGFRETMQKHGLTVAAGSVVMGDWTAVSGRQVGRELLSRPDRPTAVVAASDELALGVLAAARELGLAVPADVSVIGIDDHEMADLNGLTTVAQPVVEQGRMATQLLLSAVAGHDLGHEVATVPTRLVVRSSTGAPPVSADAARHPAPVSAR